MIFPDIYTIKLDHAKDLISGFWFGLDTAFWWFHDKSLILYHYSYPGGGTLTKYLELPDDINKQTHEIIGYEEESSILILKKL